MPVLWIFLAALLVFGLQRSIYRRFWARRLHISLRFDRQTATAGEDVTLLASIRNRKLLPLPVLRFRYNLAKNFELLRGENGRVLEHAFRVGVPSLRTVRRQAVLPAVQRGVYTVTDSRLEAQDLFDTVRMEQAFVSYTQLTVYPAKLPVRQLELPYRLLLGMVLTRRRAQEDPFELRGIRPYEIYDSMRQINWKASARTGELKVNQHDYTTDEAVQLIVDVEHGSIAERETLLSLASSLCSLLLHRGVSVALCANGRSCIGGRPVRIRGGSGGDHLRVIDESLAQIKLGAAPTQTMTDYLTRLTDGLKPDALCVLLSAAVDAPLAAAFDRLCAGVGGCLLSPDPQAPAGRFYTCLPWQTAQREVSA